VIEHPTTQRLVADPVLVDISQRYFRTRPVFDFVALWWNTAYLSSASSEAAQLYHFDMDRLKFVKFFIYLTDVGPQNGPHTYVAGSHRRKPRALHRDGRFSDHEVERHYNPADIIEITGPRGTVFVADTRGFHKGTLPIAGDRLLLQIEFATNLFGQTYPPVYINETFTESFKATLAKYPEIYGGSVRRASQE
jgi:hypothetical protein